MSVSDDEKTAIIPPVPLAYELGNLTRAEDPIAFNQRRPLLAISKRVLIGLTFEDLNLENYRPLAE